MFGVIVNTVAILAGSGIGLLLRRGIPRRISDALMEALGLCTILIGIQGAVKEEHILLLIVAVVAGVAIGEAFCLEERVNRFAERVTSRFRAAPQEGSAAKDQRAAEDSSERIANAFVTSCLIMNVGAMVIVGSLDAGLRGDNTLLYTKSLLDFVSGIMMSAAMGVGVMGSAAFTFLFQGAIVLLAAWLAPLSSDTLIAELGTTGSVLILAIGLNMIQVTKFRVINYLPSLLVVPVLIWLFL